MSDMNKPTLFVSCGQRTDQEKLLGSAICRIITDTGTFSPFFAEEQSDLNGLHENIMAALASAAGFIAVMHPRGAVIVPGHSDPLITRASVWVEQEIAIAAFINRSRRQKIPVAVYSHASVGREGMRDLLHLNPVKFKSDDEILADLAPRISKWKFSESKDSQGELSLEAARSYGVHIGEQFTLAPVFRNEGPRANEYSFTLHVPSLLLRDFGCSYALEVPAERIGYKAFRMTEANRPGQPILNDSVTRLQTVDISVSRLTATERASLAKTPFYVSAQIGDRPYRDVVPVADIVPLD